jgi:hypothetical protein
MTGNIGAEASAAGAKKRENNLAINSVEQLIGVFLTESVGLYVKQKNNENNDLGSHEEVMDWVKEDLGTLLKGLALSAKGPEKAEIIAASQLLGKSLDEYVEKLDNSISKAMNNYLKKAGNLQPNGLAKDEAMLKVAPNSSYAKVGEALLKGKAISTFSSRMYKICTWVYDKMGKSDKANEYRVQGLMNMRKSLELTSDEKSAEAKKTPLSARAASSAKASGRGGK